MQDKNQDRIKEVASRCGNSKSMPRIRRVMPAGYRVISKYQNETGSVLLQLANSKGQESLEFSNLSPEQMAELIIFAIDELGFEEVSEDFPRSIVR